MLCFYPAMLLITKVKDPNKSFTTGTCMTMKHTMLKKNIDGQS